MKRFFLPLFLIVLMLAAGCAQKAPAEADRVDGTLEEIMQKVYDGSGLTELPKLGNTVITTDNKEYFLGSSAIPMSEGLASEAMISSIPHSVCLIRLPEGTDAEEVKTQLQKSANPNKWICVGVDDSNVIVDSIGDLVILIMADDAAKLQTGFLALKG